MAIPVHECLYRGFYAIYTTDRRCPSTPHAQGWMQTRDARYPDTWAGRPKVSRTANIYSWWGEKKGLSPTPLAPLSQYVKLWLLLIPTVSPLSGFAKGGLYHQRKTAWLVQTSVNSCRPERRGEERRISEDNAQISNNIGRIGASRIMTRVEE